MRGWRASWAPCLLSHKSRLVPKACGAPALCRTTCPQVGEQQRASRRE